MKAAFQAAGAGLVLGVLQLAAPVSASGSSVASDLARCAAITGADQRLACYDTLARRTLPPPPAAAAAAASPARSASGAAAVAPAAAAVAAQAPATPAPQNFGLTSHEQSAPSPPQDMQALVTRVTTDHQYNVLVTLDNSQIWTFNESDPALHTGDKVSIKRAALGSYLMITANHHSYHVRRVQ